VFLPTTKSELKNLKWNKLDVILVSGDTYLDTYYDGISVIGKVLVNAGYKVGIIAQPDIITPDDIMRLGEPSLFWGVSSGCVDSMVANYTALKKKKHSDDMTPGGINNLRPDRAVIAYTNLIKKNFKNTVPIIIGGIEASLRRIAHYDYWSDSIRRSILFDSKADILVYGMGEKTILELAGKLKSNQELRDTRGICYISKTPVENYIELPAFEEVNGKQELGIRNWELGIGKQELGNRNWELESGKQKLEIRKQENEKPSPTSYSQFPIPDPQFPIPYSPFPKMFYEFYKNNDPLNAKGLMQKHGDRYLIQNPPNFYPTEKEMDEIYGLDFERDVHPYYKKKGKVKALDTIQFSINSHRGCFGECNFCAITVHQGRKISSRSEESIIFEAVKITKNKDFKGYISDVGGPTADMYGMTCQIQSKSGSCKNKRCAFPDICKKMDINHHRQAELLKKLRKIPGIKKIFLGSGIRYDLIIADDKSGKRFLYDVIEHHISGQMKIAPEHTEPYVLNAMGKASNKYLVQFKKEFDKINKELGKKQFLTYYFIAAHPCCDNYDMQDLKQFINKELKIIPEQVQIFTPTPSTYSTLMYYTGLDPFKDENIFVEKDLKKKEKQKEELVR